jgi:hypothetical protein
MLRVCLAVLASGALIFGLTGCGESKRQRPNTVPVSGTLYLDQKPLADAEIRFYSADFVGFAVSNSEGKYELTQGALPGENRITIRRVESGYNPDPESGQDLSQLEFAQESAVGSAGEQANVAKKLQDQGIPPQYSDPEKTQLKMEVPEDGTDTADFRITSK